MSIRIKRVKITQARRALRVAGALLALLIALKAAACAEDTEEYSVCPPEGFAAFLEEFTANAEAQKAYTRFPLEKLKMVEADPLPKRVIEYVNEAQISFPVITGQVGGNVEIRQCERNRIIVHDRKQEGFGTPLYIFEKNPAPVSGQGWRLVRIENWAWPASAQSSWLVNIFPSMKACIPVNGIAYDPRKGTSVQLNARGELEADHPLEAKGYHDFWLEDRHAIYAIYEKFFGFEATELKLPTIGTDFFEFRITLNASAEDVARTIKEITGIIVPVLAKNEKSKDGVIYIRRNTVNSVYVNCDAYEEL